MAEYIEREAAVKVVKDYGKGAISDGMKSLDPVDDIVMLAKAFEFIPAADVAPVVHGQWIPISDDEWAECSECGESYEAGDEGMTSFGLFRRFYKYCPNCSARMDFKEQADV